MDRCSFRLFHSHLQAHRPTACHVCYSHKQTTGSFFSIREYWTCVKRDKGLPGLLATRFCQDASVRACTEACHVREGSIYERGLKHKLVSFTDFSSSGHATHIANWEASCWVSSGHPVMWLKPPDGSGMQCPQSGIIDGLRITHWKPHQ